MHLHSAKFAFINKVKGNSISKEDEMHTTLSRIILLTREVKASLVDGALGDIGGYLDEIEKLAREADSCPEEYLRVLLRELMATAKHSEIARGGLTVALSQVPYRISCGAYEGRIFLDDPVGDREDGGVMLWVDPSGPDSKPDLCPHQTRLHI